MRIFLTFGLVRSGPAGELGEVTGVALPPAPPPSVALADQLRPVDLVHGDALGIGGQAGAAVDRAVVAGRAGIGERARPCRPSARAGGRGSRTCRCSGRRRCRGVSGRSPGWRCWRRTAGPASSALVVTVIHACHGRVASSWSSTEEPGKVIATLPGIAGDEGSGKLTSWTPGGCDHHRLAPGLAVVARDRQVRQLLRGRRATRSRRCPPHSSIDRGVVDRGLRLRGDLVRLPGEAAVLRDRDHRGPAGGRACRTG